MRAQARPANAVPLPKVHVTSGGRERVLSRAATAFAALAALITVLAVCLISLAIGLT